MRIGDTLLERYRIEAELGRGGMGVVYRAFDSLLDRAVAIKFLSDPALEAPGRARLLHEAQAAARLNHPNIVSIFDASASPEGQPFIIMELLERESLRQYARLADEQGRNSTGERLAISEVYFLAGQICAALEHAHQAGIIHRDLKPDNILVLSPTAKSSNQGVKLKLMDFGLARSLSAPMLTQEGAILGTFYYLAPELLMGQAASPQSDLYALGVILYEMVTGRLPFSGDNLMAVLSQHLHATPIPPSSSNPTIAPNFESLILRLLEKLPDQRFKSAQEVQEKISELTKAQPAEQRDGMEGTLLSTRLSLLDRIVRGRIVSREDELAVAADLWKKASSGEGNVLLISGEPGIGKSRLAREISAIARLERAATLVGECYAEGGAPFSPMAAPIQQGLALLPPQGGGNPGQRHPLLPQHLADLIALTPALRLEYPEIQLNPKLDPQSELQRLYESVAVLFTALSERQAVLVLIEDVHWADSGSLALLRHLARRLRAARILIVLTYREVELDEARPLHELLLYLNRERLASRIKLTRLNKEKTREMLSVMFAEEISDEFLEGIYQETEGNPFFIEEVCRALVESGQVYFGDGKWHRPPKMDQLVIPQSVRLAIQSRVDQLPTEAQDVLRLASVFGREFNFEALSHACELDEEIMITSLESATRGLLIQELPSSKGMDFSFTHALIPATLSENISGPRRRILHRRVAHALEAVHSDAYDQMAVHFAQAGESDQAIECYRKAARRASALFSFDSAVNFLDDAASLLDESHSAELHGKLLEELADTQLALGVNTSAIANYQEALAARQRISSNDSITTIRLHRKIMESVVKMVWFADREKYSPVAERSLTEVNRLLPSQSPNREVVQTMLTLARFLFNIRRPADLEAARQTAEKAIQVAETLDDPVILCNALENLVIILSALSKAQQRLQFAQRMLDLSRQGQFQDPPQRINAQVVYGYVLNDVGEYRQALTYFLEAEKLAIEIQAVYQHAAAIRARAESWFRLDEWDKTLEAVSEYLALEQRYVNFSQRSGPRCYLIALAASIHALRGEMAESLALSQESRSIMTAVNGPPERWDRSNLY